MSSIAIEEFGYGLNEVPGIAEYAYATFSHLKVIIGSLVG